MPNNEKSNKIDDSGVKFFQGNKELEAEQAKVKVHELCNLKNLNFLFGAGTSSGAIPTMKQIKKDLDTNLGSNDNLNTIYQEITKDNLEDVLNVLHAKRFYLGAQGVDSKEELSIVKELIQYIQEFMFKKINIEFDDKTAEESLKNYKSFYQKLALRNKDLARLNVFTTNNDLFNEKALDHLNINYNNGFGGGLERVFNPARFRYTFSRKVDLNLEKFEPLENMVYLYKLHGSINWEETEGNSLFNIKEKMLEGGEENPQKTVLIYPTPMKQNQSLGSPYSDLIREFQLKMSLPNSVLFIVGYSFSDEHLNNIIYQSLASNSSLSLFIFGNYEKSPLTKIGDDRIYRYYSDKCIGQDSNKAHYFENIVNNLLPNTDENRDKELLDNFVKQLNKSLGKN